MSKPVLPGLGRSIVGVMAAALLAACSNEPTVAPNVRVVDLGNCENLSVPAGSTLAYRTYAQGVQIYRWSGTSWVFVEPSAVLFADAKSKGAVGSHYAGPTWQSLSGSKVVGAVAERCTADANAIQWLLLRAVSTAGPGVFDGTTFIQRVHTVGGIAPSTPGGAPGDLTSVPYTAEYYFYRS